MKTTVKPTEEQVRAAGNDFFAARDLLLQQLRDSEAQEARLNPAAASEPWPIEPDADDVEARMKSHGDDRQRATDILKAKMSAGAQRLAQVSPAAATEISQAMANATAARERAQTLLTEQEAVLSSLQIQVIALGDVRKKIRLVRALILVPADESALANSTLNFWLNKNLWPSPQNDSGFSVYAAELAWRLALNKHIPNYVAPLEKKAQDLIASIRSSAEEAKIDLRKFMQIMASTRGQGGPELDMDGNLYSGLWN